MSSLVAVMGAAAPQLAYTASKGGVLAMTREIAVQHARRNIRCNALLPGPIGTPLTAQLFDTPETLERRRVHMPMGRCGQAVEVAEVALFFLIGRASCRESVCLYVLILVVSCPIKNKISHRH